MSARKRPTSVTIIALSEILITGIILFNILIHMKPGFRQLMEISGGSLAISVLWGIVVGVIALVSGIAMLKGSNWERLLYHLCYPSLSFVLVSLLYRFHYSTFFY